MRPNARKCRSFSTGPLALICLLASTPSRALDKFHVFMDTSSLIGHPAAPFSLSFELNDGSGTGDHNNTATLNNFDFGGGTTLAAPTLIGGASGDASGTVTLTDSGFLNEFLQPFTPGQTLNFDVSLTTNVDVGPTPDEFSFAIKDCMLSELPTQGPADSLMVVDLTSATPAITTYAGDQSRAPACGGPPIPLAAPRAIVPEPSPLALLLLGLPGLLLLGRKRRARIVTTDGSHNPSVGQPVNALPEGGGC